MSRGVLLMAYGAPERPEDIEPFYTDIRRGKPPTPELLAELAERYTAIGGLSPLPAITRAQAQALEDALGGDYRVYVGMRHWNPRIAATVQQMAYDGITEAVAIVLAPHYSQMSVGKYFALLDEAVATVPEAPTFHKIASWHTHPLYLDALADRTRESLRAFPEDEQSDVMVVFTAHSLPKRIQESNDPYPDQLMETARRIATALELPLWRLAYQSAGRTPDPWLGPDLLDVVNEEADAARAGLVVCVIGFVADHLEVLYDIDIEAQALAADRGLPLERIQMFNDDPALARCLADLVRAALDG